MDCDFSLHKEGLHGVEWYVGVMLPQQVSAGGSQGLERQHGLWSQKDLV